MLGLFRAGFVSILIANPRDLKSIIGPVKQYGPAFMAAVNSLYSGLLNNEEFC